MSVEILKRGFELGRYQIRELLGQGGMGRVYRAWDPALSRDVAIKVLGAPEPELLKRFLREAEAVSKLNHPNVISILDFSVGPPPYLVMAHLRGQDLASRLKRGRLQVGEAVDILLGACAGVHACHEHGITHRDLKPGNVFLQETAEGTVVKVLDFGVANLGQDTSGDLTQPGHAVGTPRYFSPEQVQHADVDARSDQYALGLLLYVALFGKSPFAGMEGNALVRAILKAEYPRLREVRPDVTPALEAAIATAMHVNRERRFPSVHAFGRAVVKEATAEGQSVWGEHFAPAGTVEVVASPANAVQVPMANVTTQHSTPTVEDMGVGDADTTINENVPAVRAPVVVVPIAPLPDAPVVATTERLPSETAVDFSQARRDAVKVDPTVDLYLWSRPNLEPVSQPVTRTPQTTSVWQRRPAMIVAIAALVLLAGCATWVLARLVGQ